MQICNTLGVGEYVNPPGGRALYGAKNFRKGAITLNFLAPPSESYGQFDGDFIPRLSIIDVLMFSPVEKVRKLVGKYRLREAS